MTQRWTIERAREWSERQPWFFGANFTPSTAINQLEMWQAETFDPETIGRELGYARDIGMTLMRVYLHDLLWEHDRDGFVERIEKYLSLADSNGIKTMFVIFDDCWNGEIALGKQPAPKPFTHNSGWLQSPGHAIAEDPTQWPRLERYVKELLGHFRDDPRIALWDLYNEPGNGEEGDADADTRRGSKSVPLVKAVFEWARAVEGLSQPLTMGIWYDLAEMNATILERCDVVSFHTYDAPESGFVEKVERALSHSRPAICSEYMARGRGCTHEACLPILKERGVGAIQWGLVSGKTQTIYPWGWNAEKGEPPVYFHDLLNPDGTFLYPEEENVLRRIVGSR